MATMKEEFVKDSSLEGLLQEEFDAKTFASAAIQSQMVGETLGKLTNGIALLDKELYTQVVGNYEDLLSQATGIEALEGVLKMMHTRIESLQLAVARIDSKVVEPYNKIVSRTAQLARLQSACDLLRKVMRMLYLLKRLRSQMQGGSREITKVAQTFSEIDTLVSSGDLTGIAILEEERVWLHRARREVEAQAKRMLLQGLELMNPTPVSVSLQVFYNLCQLSSTLHAVLSGFRAALQHDSQIALDPATLVQGLEGSSYGSGGHALPGPTLASSASWKASLWTRLEKLANSIHKLHGQVQQLYIVLLKKKDPVSHKSFLDNITEDDTRQLLVHFWATVAEDLSVELNAAAQASTFLRQLFECDYPKLLRVFLDLISRLERFGAPSSPHSSSLYSVAGGQGEREESNRLAYEAALLKALSPFEKAYVSRSQSRLLEAVNQVFGNSFRGLPKEDDILAMAKSFNSELSSAGSSGPLCAQLARNMDKAVQLFTIKCQDLVLRGREALQVSSGPNHPQLRNITIVNCLHSLSTLLTQHVVEVSTTQSAGRIIVSESLATPLSLLSGVVSPFVQEVQHMMGEMVESMHTEDYSGEVRRDMMLGTPEPPCSGFMREMLSFTSRIHTQHLSKFQCRDELHTLLVGVAARVLDLYVRHVTLLRPLGEGGKMRVTTDMAQMELALAPFHQRLADLGAPYQRLRALRRLLFLSTEQFHADSASPGIGDPLPYSYVLNYLFSRAPADMKSPHRVQGWSEKKYSDWMDSHLAEADRLAFIQATVESYCKRSKVQASKEGSAAEISHIMLGLLQKGSTAS